MMSMPLVVLLVAAQTADPAEVPTDAQRDWCAQPEQSGHSQCIEPNGPEWNLDYPVEAQPNTEESRSTARVRLWVGAGMLTSPNGATEAAPGIIIGKPLYLFTRHRHFQGVLDSHFGVAMAVPSRRVSLTIAPQMGLNWYFGQYVGFEGRAGLGFGSQLSSQVSHFGVAIVLDGGIVVRPFADDRKRLKLGGAVSMQILFDNTTAVAGMAALGFETAF